MDQLTKNFSRHEFADPVTGDDDINLELVEMLQVARDIVGRPVIITSGVRSSHKNRDVGGDQYSSHLYGMAADIKCSDSTYRFALIAALIRAGFKRIGIDDEHVHVDIDPTKPQNVFFLE